MQGRWDEAAELFERLLGLTNDVGLLAEEYDPVARRQLGNFPQAFSHVGLVNTAMNLSAREARRAAPGAEGSLAALKIGVRAPIGEDPMHACGSVTNRIASSIRIASKPQILSIVYEQVTCQRRTVYWEKLSARRENRTQARISGLMRNRALTPVLLWQSRAHEIDVRA